MPKYDFLIVGAGLFGSVCARQLTDSGYKVCVIEKRNHIGGNCYTKKINNIDVHFYGAHIFHTSNRMIWEYVNKFVKFNNYTHHVVAKYKNKIYSLPFNMWTFNQFWNITTPQEAMETIDSQRFKGVPTNLEEKALSIVGRDIYETLIRGYTSKQWMRDPKTLPESIINRLPVRFTYNNMYFYDFYQGIPENGYTELFEKLLDGIEVRLETDYLLKRDEFDSMSHRVIYTGPIDKFYNYKYGYLNYRTLNFEHKTLEIDNFQGHSVVNYTEQEVPYTRIIEHKHFYPNKKTDNTVISYEYPVEWTPQKEPIYPINDEQNTELYLQYKKLNPSHMIIFGGRLAEYQYYDMHQVVASALKTVSKII